MSAEIASRPQFSLKALLVLVIVVAFSTASVSQLPEWIGAPVLAFVATAAAAFVATAAGESKGRPRAFFIGAAFPLFVFLLRTAAILPALARGFTDGASMPTSQAFVLRYDMNYVDQRFYYRWEALSAMACAPLIGLICAASCRLVEPRAVRETSPISPRRRSAIVAALLLVALAVTFAGTIIIRRFPRTEKWDLHDGSPVLAIGSLVTASTLLKSGDKVFVEQQGSWWRARVKQVREDGSVLIHYVGWESNWDEVVPRSRLRLPE